MKSSKLGLFDLTMIVIGLVIGMGIFRAATDSAKDALTPGIFFAGWIVGGLVALCGALTYAEIGSRHPVTGGYYKIFSYAYHPSLAFSINCIILVSNAASLSAVALIGSGYISRVLFNEPATDTMKVVIAIIAIVIFYGVNLMGLKMSSRTQNVLMLIKISMVLLLIAALCFPHLYAEPAVAAASATSVTEHGFMDVIKSFGLCLVAISFTYGGYQQSINFGHEVKNASRTVPKGIFIGITTIIVLYLLVNFSYYKLIGFEQLKTTNEIASVVAEKMFGSTGSTVFSGLLFLSVLAYVNVLLLSNPRVMYAMSDDGVLPPVFKKQSEKKEVLVTSLTVFAATCIVVLFFAKTFNEILSFTIFLDCFGMAMSAGAIFKLRKQTKHLDGTGIYSMKLYPLQPVIFILAYSFVGISIAIDKPKTALIGIGVLLAFIVLYFLMRKRKGAESL